MRDAALTNPEGMDAVMRIIPEWALNVDGHRKGGNWTAYQKSNAGKILLKESECAEIVRAVANCHAEPKAEMFLTAPGEFQHTIKWLDDETGLWLRCRFDKVSYLPVGLFGCDVKTCANNSPRAFTSAIAEWGYHRQAAHYLDGLIALGEEPDGWVNITIGKPDPQTCIVYELDEEWIKLGREQNRKLFRELAQRLQSDDWRPRTYDQVLKLTPPQWAVNNQWEVIANAN